MINVLVHHEVADYPAWKAMFDSGLDFRHQLGERCCRIFRRAANPNDLTLIFEWDNLDKARTFLASDELKARMKASGVKGEPRVEFLNELHTYRRSAAD